MRERGLKKHKFLKALINFTLFSVVVVAVIFYFVYDNFWIGPVFLGLGFLNLFILKIFKIELKSVYPDILFGIIDNGVLVFTAVGGGLIAGVTGAVIGGAAGNTITDGFGGLFEGYVAEHHKSKINFSRTALSSSFGKSAGCLLGAGVGLILVWLISLI